MATKAVPKPIKSELFKLAHEWHQELLARFRQLLKTLEEAIEWDTEPSQARHENAIFFALERMRLGGGPTPEDMTSVYEFLRQLRALNGHPIDLKDFEAHHGHELLTKTVRRALKHWGECTKSCARPSSATKLFVYAWGRMHLGWLKDLPRYLEEERIWAEQSLQTLPVRMFVHEVNVAALAFSIEHPNATIRQFETAIGASKSTIQKTPAWKAHKAMRNNNRPARSPKVCRLTSKLEANIDARGKMGRNISTSSASSESAEALAKLLADQTSDFEPSPLDKSVSKPTRVRRTV